MTRDNKKKNIAAELARAEAALTSARILLAAGQLADAVSRAYYACFYAARALLLTEGVESKSHGGVDRLLQRDFVATGKLDAGLGRSFSALQKFRHDADYVAEFVFTAEAVASDLASAEKLVTTIRDLLAAGGWTD